MLDLELTVREGRGERLECSLAYNLDLFDASTAQRMLDHVLVRLLASCAGLTSLPLTFTCRRSMRQLGMRAREEASHPASVGGGLQVLLAAAAVAPETVAAALPLMSADERERVVTVFNSADEDLDLEYSCLHELFQQHARRQPSARCLVCEDEELTYGEVGPISLSTTFSTDSDCMSVLTRQSRACFLRPVLGERLLISAVMHR